MTHLCPSCGQLTDHLTVSGGRWWFCLWCEITGKSGDGPEKSCESDEKPLD